MQWAAIISIFYFLLLTIFVLPILVFFTEIEILQELYHEYLFWITVFTISLGQFLLLFLKVKELPLNRKPKGRLWGTACLMGLFAGILFAGLSFSLLVLVDPQVEVDINIEMEFYEMFGLFIGVAWGTWMLYFYIFHRHDKLHDYFDQGISLLLKGSVFELLICIPAHIIVRQRNECCAHFVTGLGLACGFSVMLLCFGPVALALIYKRVQLKKHRTEI